MNAGTDPNPAVVCGSPPGPTCLLVVVVRVEADTREIQMRRNRRSRRRMGHLGRLSCQPAFTCSSMTTHISITVSEYRKSMAMGRSRLLRLAHSQKIGWQTPESYTSRHAGMCSYTRRYTSGSPLGTIESQRQHITSGTGILSAMLEPRREDIDLEVEPSHLPRRQGLVVLGWLEGLDALGRHSQMLLC
jgi:hypothetical protein